MKMNSEIQLTLCFPIPGKSKMSERAKDSEGRFAAEKEDPDALTRIKTENRILRINYAIWLNKKDKEIQRLKKVIKELKNTSPLAPLLEERGKEMD